VHARQRTGTARVVISFVRQAPLDRAGRSGANRFTVCGRAFGVIALVVTCEGERHGPMVTPLIFFDGRGSGRSPEVFPVILAATP
jgi:hypothetical protein